MTKMLKEMLQNYKMLIDEHEKDFERGCYKDFEEYKGVLEDEYKIMVDTLRGLLRYEAITIQGYDKVTDECFAYAIVSAMNGEIDERINKKHK